MLEKTVKLEYRGVCYDSIPATTAAWLVRQSIPGPDTVFLDLQGSQLDWLPTADNYWKTFTELRTIHIENNQLQSLPTAILLAPALEEVIFNGNPLRDFPESIKKDWATLKKHLQMLRKNAIDWRERKIILVGPPSAGK
jgi:hypothetical protein